MQPTIAFITGVTGQDGAYLAQFLLDRGYEVHGLVRWDAVEGTQRLAELGIQERITLHYGDMNDAACLIRLIKDIHPDEIYNLAALSHVAVSFETPSSALSTNAQGTLNLLEAIRILDMQTSTKMYQASTSEMFGNAPAPQNEETVMKPCSPYAVAKLAGYHLVQVYRESYDVHASNGILFNHESPLRGEDFVTRKITRAVAAIEAGKQERLMLGNLDSVRDWGHAKDYVEGMWLMLQQETPDDYVLATGEAHTVRAFVSTAFAHIDVAIEWRGEGLGEVGVNMQTGDVLVKIDPQFFRPNEVHHLLGDPSKAKAKLDWIHRYDFDSLVADMMQADRAAFASGNMVWEHEQWRLRKTG